MKKVLDESVVLQLMREEWASRKAKLREELDVTYKSSKGAPPKGSISPGLKIREKKTGTLYTVNAVGGGSAVLRDPEGRMLSVDSASLEKDYELN